MPSKLVFLVLLLGAAVPAAADLYKWVDSKGQVHYADQLPSGQESQRIGPSSNPHREAEAEAARRALADKLSQSRLQQQQAQAAEAKRQSEAEKQRRKEEACRIARERLAVFQHNGPIARVNDRGERYFLDEARRQSEAVAAQKRVEEVCR